MTAAGVSFDVVQHHWFILVLLKVVVIMGRESVVSSAVFVTDFSLPTFTAPKTCLLDHDHLTSQKVI